MSTAFEGESIGKNLQSGLTADRGEFDPPAVVDGAGERQHSIIADDDAIRVVHHGIEVEDEIIRREILDDHSIKGNRCYLRNRNHRIAFAIRGRSEEHTSELQSL